MRRGSYSPKRDGSSSFCAGMLIYNEKRKQYPVGMQLAERFGIYVPGELNMDADVY